MFYQWIFLVFLALVACSPDSSTPFFQTTGREAKLYSLTGQEHKVQFKALYQTKAKSLAELNTSSLVVEIRETTTYLSGPMTTREIGGAQKGEVIFPHLKQAYVAEGHVFVPYSYAATWMMHKQVLADGPLLLPLPYSVESLKTPGWKKCTDSSDEEHQTWTFFWYFWDPERPGCDHRKDVQYQEVAVQIGDETQQTTESFPEYARMIRVKKGVPTLSMTFAFGYVSDNAQPEPFSDKDTGMLEFQSFYKQIKNQLSPAGFVETPIYQKDITYGSRLIGAKFVGLKQKVQMEVSIVAAAGVDQMDLFAYSYAQNHEGFFGWFGHSRVGSGFDADRFAEKLQARPDAFSLSSDYQLVYWAGCNSYSYYTQPFFELKSYQGPLLDPKGTKNLDLMSNTLPSLFIFNAANATVLFQALSQWQKPTSYQVLIQKIEKIAHSVGEEVIVNVLGDEDNNN